VTVSPTLVADLQKQVLALEADLRQRIELPQFHGDWLREHTDAVAGDRTAAGFTEWADDRITQAAVSWVLTSVFVRFCEDNALVRPVWIAGPPSRRQEALDAQLAYFRAHPEHTDREWLSQAFAYLAATPATAGLVDDQAMLHAVSPSGLAVTKLLEFWRTVGPDGKLVHDFTEPGLSTRFLGDLYQDLSEYAKKTYALLQTPEFVEEFILDRTMNPALADRPLPGFKMIDPACGSGHFLLGAFRRLLTRWDAEAPGLGQRERVQKALDAVWGVDLNAFAVAIAKFRLTVAALQACDEATLEKAPGFELNLLVGDSLWFSHDQDQLFHTDDDFAYSHEHREALQKALTRGRYDCVVANPPYITVKDPKLNLGYRERYNHLRGKYALTAPFMELLFKLAREGNHARPAGWVGQITSNSFMKREFGAPLVEELLSTLDLREVIDTSGAYIPGHGTPTAILIGRNARPTILSVRTVAGIRGEPGRPLTPHQGVVWQAIVDWIDQPGTASEWIEVENRDRSTYLSHPWSLTGGGATQVAEQIDLAAISRLGKIASAIGYSSITGDDEFMVTRVSHARRLNGVSCAYVIGEEIRDYAFIADHVSIIPQQPDGKPLTPTRPVETHFWRGRSILKNRLYFGKRPLERGLRWFDYAIYFAERSGVKHKLVYSNIGTHNHFAVDNSQSIFNAHGQVIVIASWETSLATLGVLNSSTACFWLKQNSHNKGSTVDTKGARQTTVAWENFYEFTGTTLKDFPLPKALPLERARTLDALAQELSAQQVAALVEAQAPTAELLVSAEAAQASLKRRMIAQQEELDWEVYQSYGLLDDALVYAGEPPEVALGERAFEIVLARAMSAGAEDTAWFERHGSTPITEIPAHWPADYRDLVQRRIDAIESVDAIRLLEKPEYKRRWASESFAKQADAALRAWLLDKLEDRDLWFSRQGHPTPLSISQLADRLGRDETFTSVIDLWKGQRDADLVRALTDLLEPEAVPYLAAMRLKDTGLRKFAAWQHTWALQRQEDAMRPSTSSGNKLAEPVEAPRNDPSTSSGNDKANARADAFAQTIPVPPKYALADFRKPAYWAARGKLDVPKERFILYPDAGRDTDPTLLLGWAGWDHAQQSLALATLIASRRDEGADDARLIPLVAGMAELQPWVEQWHADVDLQFGVSPASFCGETLRGHQQALGVTTAELDAWRPTPTTRGRKARR